MSKKYDVALLGYYGFKNLGDELLLESIVAILKESGVDSEQMAVLSSSPEETSNRLKLVSYNRWKLLSIAQVLKSSRTLLLGGGGLFQDRTSVRSCFYYWLIIRLASVYGVKIWTVGQSIGPLGTTLGRWLTKNAFLHCAYRDVRDNRSRDILANWGMSSEVSPDYVMAMKPSRCNGEGKEMLFNLRPGYRPLASEVLQWALRYAKNKGLTLVPVALALEDCEELKALFLENGLIFDRITLVKSLPEFENISKQACAAVGMRLHFLVLSLLSGLSVGAGVYDPKVASLCESFSIPDICKCDSLSAICDDNCLQRISDEVKVSLDKGLKAVLEA